MIIHQCQEISGNSLGSVYFVAVSGAKNSSRISGSAPRIATGTVTSHLHAGVAKISHQMRLRPNGDCTDSLIVSDYIPPRQSENQRRSTGPDQCSARDWTSKATSSHFHLRE